MNEAFNSKFKLSDRNQQYISIFKIKNSQWNFPEFKTLLHKISKRTESIKNYEIIHYFEELGIRRLLIDIEKIESEDEKTKYYLITFKDVTSQTDSDKILGWIEKKLNIINTLGEVYSTVSFNDLFRQTSNQIVKTLGCTHCICGYLDNQGNVIIPQGNKVKEGTPLSEPFVIPKKEWQTQFGTKTLEQRMVSPKKEFKGPQGKIIIYNSLSLAIRHKDKDIGRILAINKPSSFNQLDKNLLLAIGSYIAPLLHDKLIIEKMKQNQQHLETFVKESKKMMKSELTIDKIDEQILNGLYNDGSTTLLDLSEKVIKPDGESMSGTGVKKRIRKLKKREILKIQGNIDLEKLNYKLVYYLVNLKDYKDKEKLSKLENICSKVFMLAEIMGKYQILIGFYGRNMGEINKCINNCAIIKEFIDKKNSDLFRILNLRIPTFYPVKVVESEKKVENCKYFNK